MAKRKYSKDDSTFRVLICLALGVLGFWLLWRFIIGPIVEKKECKDCYNKCLRKGGMTEAMYQSCIAGGASAMCDVDAVKRITDCQYSCVNKYGKYCD